MNRVREYREALNMKREQLAAKADISYQFVRALESDSPPADIELGRARRLAKALGTTVSKLFPAGEERR